MKIRRERGFTLIELLIVVAIIAVLAAIAVPNFLEASTRSRVSRVNSDERTMYMACEMYRVDNNDYPTRSTMMSPGGWWQSQLTTPIAYLAPCNDPFTINGSLELLHYQYASCPMMKSLIFDSIGPDLTNDFNEAMWMCAWPWLIPRSMIQPTVRSARAISGGANKQGGPIPQQADASPMGSMN